MKKYRKPTSVVGFLEQLFQSVIRWAWDTFNKLGNLLHKNIYSFWAYILEIIVLLLLLALVIIILYIIIWGLLSFI